MRQALRPGPPLWPALAPCLASLGRETNFGSHRPVRGEPLCGYLPASISRKGRKPPLCVPREGESSQSPSGLEPVGAEAAPAAAGGRGRWGTCPSRWWAWRAARCWQLDRQPHTHQAGTSNAPTALPAQRVQSAHSREGEPRRRKGVQDAVP